MTEKIHLIVSDIPVEERLDVYLAKRLADRFSRQDVKRAVVAGTIQVNGRPAKPKTLVSKDDVITGALDCASYVDLKPESIPIKITYEDSSFMVIEKPAGLVVHPGAGNKSGTLVNALLGASKNLSFLEDPSRPGIVHRLDKDTSGLIVVAKNNRAHRHLQNQFATHQFQKTYYAIVKGQVEFEEGSIHDPIGRHAKIRYKMSVRKDADARDAETHYKVMRRFKASTLLKIELVTGRTHQIRVHMAHLGYPVLGDALYGSQAGASRQMLHAGKIQFEHPVSGHIMEFECEWPKDFEETLARQEPL